MLTDVEKAERILKGGHCQECFEEFGNLDIWVNRSAIEPRLCLHCCWKKKIRDNNADRC